MIALDIDGVVADFLSPFLRLLETRAGNGPIPADTIRGFTFQDHPFLTDEIVWKCMEEVSYDSEFWGSLSSLISPEDWFRLNELSQCGKLAFVTHRFVRDTYSIHDVSTEWLCRHGISRPVVYFTQEPKGKLIQDLGAKLFVDDRYENCQEVAENTRALVFMPHRPYNQDSNHPRVQRFWHFDELYPHFEKLKSL
jgi:uncharacterized HAD superfamily protein